MKKAEEIPVDSLERIFHEPNRLSLLAALCASNDPISFSDLKNQLAVSEGILTQNLYALEEKGIIKIKKSFVDRRPRTTISMTNKGFEDFQHYVRALGATLKLVHKSMPSKPRASWFGVGKKATA